MSRATTDAPEDLSTYRELPPRPELSDLLVCRWQQRVGTDRVQRVVPDGCIDVVWRAGRELVVAGPATRALLAPLPAGSTTVGVRFAPGAGASLAGLPLSELRDQNVPLAELWGAAAAGRLEQGLAATGEGMAQLDLLERALLARRPRAAAPDRAVIAAAMGEAGELGASGGPTVRELAGALGLGERQLLRRFRAAVGYGPKTLARVLRFQRFLRAAWAEGSEGGDTTGTPGPDGSRGEPGWQAAHGEPGAGLARIALDAGYADQAHLSRECRRLAGVSPRELLRGA